jgi:glycosyltransferase involved in cell wall biosynthesis
LYKVNRLRRKVGGIEEARAELRRRHDIGSEAPVILAVGYADKRKGVDLFVEAGVKLLARRPEARFIWLGKEAEPEWMLQAKSAALQAGVLDRFIFPGLDEDTDLYYAGADLFALTSREDPYPSVVLEAMDCGLPVVAYAGTGGMAGLIEEAGGINVPAFDTASFADEMNRILASERARTRASTQGREIIDRRFSFRQYVHDLLACGGEPLPRITVVVPNYNYATYIEGRLKSICAQTVPVYELIVLDDVSSDDSVSRIRAFLADCRIPSSLVANKKNSGSVFRQWLRGVELARGDFVWIAEADDLADPDFLAEVMPGFARSDVVMSYCQSRQMDGAGNILCEHYLDYVADIDAQRWKEPYVAEGREEIAKALYLKNTIPNVSGVMFRRDALLTTLRAHQQEILSYRNAGDWVTYVRLLETGSVAFSPRSLNSHRRHQASVTVANSNLPHLQEIVRVQNDTILRHHLDDEATAQAAHYVEKLTRQFGVCTKLY